MGALATDNRTRLLVSLAASILLFSAIAYAIVSLPPHGAPVPAPAMMAVELEKKVPPVPPPPRMVQRERPPPPAPVPAPPPPAQIEPPPAPPPPPAAMAQVEPPPAPAPAAPLPDVEPPPAPKPAPVSHAAERAVARVGAIAHESAPAEESAPTHDSPSAVSGKGGVRIRFSANSAVKALLDSNDAQLVVETGTDKDPRRYLYAGSYGALPLNKEAFNSYAQTGRLAELKATAGLSETLSIGTASRYYLVLGTRVAANVSNAVAEGRGEHGPVEVVIDGTGQARAESGRP